MPQTKRIKNVSCVIRKFHQNVWCNGNIEDSKSLARGSIPRTFYKNEELAPSAIPLRERRFGQVLPTSFYFRYSVVVTRSPFTGQPGVRFPISNLGMNVYSNSKII